MELRRVGTDPLQCPHSLPRPRRGHPPSPTCLSYYPLPRVTSPRGMGSSGARDVSVSMRQCQCLCWALVGVGLGGGRVGPEGDGVLREGCGDGRG